MCLILQTFQRSISLLYFFHQSKSAPHSPFLCHQLSSFLLIAKQYSSPLNDISLYLGAEFHLFSPFRNLNLSRISSFLCIVNHSPKLAQDILHLVTYEEQQRQPHPHSMPRPGFKVTHFERMFLIVPSFPFPFSSLFFNVSFIVT